MIRRFPHCRRGFTLIELLVVVAIIAVLAALIVPALQKAQAQAMARACMSKVKAIATSIRTYANSWDGWTNGDRDYYVKEFGYKLASEEGYFSEAAGDWATDPATRAYSHAGSVKDFRCPVDEGPKLNAHAIPASYQVTRSFAGSNVMNLQGESNRIIAASEKGARHPVPGLNDKLDRHYVYADLSATLGFKGAFAQGLRLRVWDRSSDAGITGVAETDLPDPVIEDEVSNWLTTWDWMLNYAREATTQGWTTNTHWTSTHGGPFQTANNHWNNIRHQNSAYFPNFVTARYDGFIEFPEAGDYRFQYLSNDHVRQSMGIGEKGVTHNDGPFTGTGFVSTTLNTWTADNFFSAEGRTKYPFSGVFNGYRQYATGTFAYGWENQTAGASGPAAQQIPASALFFIP